MDNEIWKDIEGYEGLYQVSNKGRIKSLERIIRREKGRWGTPSHYLKKEMIMTPMFIHGYNYVYLCKDGNKIKEAVHRLVAKAFLPNPNNYPEVNHINEIKTDNKSDNLEWCTSVYNKHHGTARERQAKSLREGGKVSGKNNPRARKVICNGVIYDCLKDCAENYKVSSATLSGYLHGHDPMPHRWMALGLAFYDEDKEAS